MTYVGEKTYMDEQSKGFKRYFDLKGDKINISLKKIKVTYKENSFKIEGKDEYKIFNGTYKLMPDDSYYTIMEDTNDISGLYKNLKYSSENVSGYNLKINKLQDNKYEIFGSIITSKDGYLFTGEKLTINNDTGKIIVKDTEYTIKYINDSLTFNSKNGFMNGTYKKTNKVKFKKIINLLDQDIQFDTRDEGVM